MQKYKQIIMSTNIFFTMILSVVVSHAIACAPGEESIGGVCQAIICDNHAFVNMTHHCEQCSPGTFTDLFYGTPSALEIDRVKATWDWNFWDEALLCGVRACTEDHRVTAPGEVGPSGTSNGGECTPCEVYEFRAAGDNTFENRQTGTVCAPRMCAQHESVANDAAHTCTPCSSDKLQNIPFDRSTPVDCTECQPAYFPDGTGCTICPFGSETSGVAKDVNGNSFTNKIIEGNVEQGILYCDLCINGWYAATENFDPNGWKCYECPKDSVFNDVISLPGRKDKFSDSFCEADEDAVHVSHPYYPQKYLDNQPRINASQYVKEDHTIGLCPVGSVATGSNETTWRSPYYAGDSTTCTCLFTLGYEQTVIPGDASCTIILCKEEQRVFNNLCIPCGRSSEGYETSSIRGLPANGVNTFCGVCGPDLFFNYQSLVCEDKASANFNCEEDEYVDTDHQCQPCTIGTYTFDPSLNIHGPGDGSGSGKTTYSRQENHPENSVCFAEQCNIDYFVNSTSKICVACPAWEKMDAGVFTSNSTDICTTRFCPVDYKVLDDVAHACIPCATGYRQEKPIERSDNTTWGVKCLQCDENYYPSFDGIECLPCSTESAPGYLSKSYDGQNFLFRASDGSTSNIISHNQTCSRCANNYHSAHSMVANTNTWVDSICERFSQAGVLLESLDAGGVYWKSADWNPSSQSDDKLLTNIALVDTTRTACENSQNDYQMIFSMSKCADVDTTDTKEECLKALFIWECYKCEFDTEAPGIKTRFEDSYCLTEYCDAGNTHVYENLCYDCGDANAPGYVQDFHFSMGEHNRGGDNTFCGKVNVAGGITDSQQRQTDAIADAAARVALIKAATEDVSTIGMLPLLTTVVSGKILKLEGPDEITLEFVDYFDNSDFQILTNPIPSMVSKCSDGTNDGTEIACNGKTGFTWSDSDSVCSKGAQTNSATNRDDCEGIWNGNLFTNSLADLTDSNGWNIAPRGNVCFRAGRVKVDCGKGWHCDGHETETTMIGCERTGGIWKTTPKGECLGYKEAVLQTKAFAGEMSGENAAGNLDQWKRIVTVAYCIDYIASSSVVDNKEATRSQLGNDVSFTVETQKCHMTPPLNGQIVETNRGVLGCSGDLLSIGSSCYFKCDDGYSLSGESFCGFDTSIAQPHKYYSNGFCTADSEADNYGASTGKTQYGTNTTVGPYKPGDTDQADVTSKTGETTVSVDSVPTCRFLPPNAIFPDNLVGGVELHHDNSTTLTATDFSQVGDNFAKIKIRFNKGALSVDAKKSYDYYLVAATNTFVERSMTPETTSRSLVMDDELAVISMDATEETEEGGNFDMGRQTIISNEDCFYDNATTTVQTCRPTATISFKKRYSVVIGAASKCAGPQFASKTYVFIRGVYSVDAVFDLKYAPGLDVGDSGFREVSPGIWIRNKVSAPTPTLMLHSDYKKSMVSMASASQTVTHAMLKAFTKLELINGQEDTSGHPVSGGASATSATQGVCRDALVESTSYDAGYNVTSGSNDGNLLLESRDGVTCSFRARMAVYQSETGIGGASKPSILSGYRADVAVAQYAQYNFGMLLSGKISQLGELSQKPSNFGTVLSTPSIADQMDPTKPEFGADIRFDVCACNKRFKYQVPTYQSGAIGKIKDNLEDACMYNEKLRESFTLPLNGEPRQVITLETDDYVPVTLQHAMAVDTNGGSARNWASRGGGTYVAQYPNSQETGTSLEIKNHLVGVAASCAYNAFFPPGIQTPFAYVRAWFKFSEATSIDQRNIDDNGNIDFQQDNSVSTDNDNVDMGTSLHNGRRLRRKLETLSKTAPPNIQHSVHFKFGVQ